MTIVLNGTTGITFPDSSQQYNGYYGFKNRIINGAMVIDQRNAGASVTPTAAGYNLDRWQTYVIAASKFSVQQNAGSVTPPVGFTKYLGITSLTALSVASSDYYALFQSIEGYNIADLGWGAAGASAVTLSFWVRSSLTGTFGGSIRNSAGDRSYPFTYTISAANTWEQKSITIAGDTSGTWLTTNNVGMNVYFALGVGATYSGTAGAWAAGNFISATGAVNPLATNGATFYITGVQLEKGSTATSFDYLDYGRSLAQCQRYYYRLVSTIGTTLSAYNLNNPVIPLKVSMRSTPTLDTGSAITAVSSGSLGTVAILSGTGVTNSSEGVYAYNSAGNWSLGVQISGDIRFTSEL